MSINQSKSFVRHLTTYQNSTVGLHLTMHQTIGLTDYKN